jgi:hypothetical protein
MSGLNLNVITENASRLGMRLQESFSEHTRDLTITRSANSVYLDASDDKSKNIRRQLDSSTDREKLDAMKRLVAVRFVFAQLQYVQRINDLSKSLYQKVATSPNTLPKSSKTSPLKTSRYGNSYTSTCYAMLSKNPISHCYPSIPSRKTSRTVTL